MKIVVIAVVMLLATGRSVVVDSAPRVVSAADGQVIDELFVGYNRPSVPGAAVAVIHRGRLAFIRTYGLANLETKTPVTERTKFRLASLTKPFTAMAVMLLVRDGRLTFDTRVADIVRDFPAYGREIRIRHLLTHTSGLRAYEEFLPKSPARQLSDRDVIKLLSRTDRLLFRPGTAFRYGDSGYAVLAVVVETVSGQPFAAFLRDRIFAPAGMTSTAAWTPSTTMSHRAFGYAATSSGFRPADQSVASTVLGDGGVYSSVRDLVAWDRALDERKLISARLQQLAWTPAALDDGTKTHYGFGWFIERHRTHGTRVYHRGDTSGFSNFIVKYPARKTTLIVLTNRQGGAAADIATAIMALPSLRVAAR